MNNDLKPINTIPNFKRFCMTIGELPTSYLETMTYYEMLVWFTEYMKNTIIPTINNNGLAVKELQDKYIELKTFVDNYFDNLDVQEEINNKLDEMAEDGTLEELIKSYINSTAIFTFGTLNEMKQSINLINGSYAKIIGNSIKNDGVNQLFYITEGTGEEIDGKNDCFILNNGLIAKRVKEKENLTLSPNITSNEKIKNLNIVNENTESGTAGISFSNQENVTVEHNNIIGGYWSARIGNENDLNDTTGIKLINNKLTSPHGLSLRQKSNSENGGKHILLLNEINNTANNPGIESWAKEVQVLFNRVKNISGSVGGTGGITLGAKPNQMAIGNYIENFSYGIELGNSNLNIVSNCFIKNCTRGIVCSSDNSDDIIINNCIIQIPENGYGIYLRSGKRVIIDNCIIIYDDTLGDYNDTNSKSGYGIQSDTYDKQVIINNSSFININRIYIPAEARVNNCTFYNVNSVYIVGNTILSNCLFHDVNNIGITAGNNRIQIFNGCMFVKSNDNTVMQDYIINGRTSSTIGIAEFNHCININCEIDSMRGDSTMGGNKRFLAQKINNIYHTFNLNQLSFLKINFENMGYTLKPGDKIIDNYNNKIWEVMTQNRQISYQNAIPTAGAFVKGDKIYNNLQSNSTIEYWLCTASGEFGTETEPVFVAHNI